jgi:NTE family protein
MARPTIGLALGSGGLRGLAHIGALRVLEQAKIPVDFIAGCSIGGLIGALYASGLDSDTIFKLAKNLKRRHWLDFVVPKMGLVAGDRTLATLRLLTKRLQFSELTIPLAVVATDLITGREIVFTDGEVASAVRASISVPGIFVPYKLDGMLLVDGAVVNPTPVDVAHGMGADIVVAVDLLPVNGEMTPTNIFDILVQTIDIVERQLLKPRESFVDILVKPKVGHLSPSSFDAIDECIALGAAAMEAALPELTARLAEWEHREESGENPSRPGEEQG